MKSDTPFDLLIYRLPDIIPNSFCTPDGAMNLTFQMNYVQANSSLPELHCWFAKITFFWILPLVFTALLFLKIWKSRGEFLLDGVVRCAKSFSSKPHLQLRLCGALPGFQQLTFSGSLGCVSTWMGERLGAGIMCSFCHSCPANTILTLKSLLGTWEFIRIV